MRIFITEDPFADLSREYWATRGDWAASWVDHPGRSLAEASVALFRRQFTVNEAGSVRLHVSADNRYRLLLDGEPVGRGPERGDAQHWRYESYDLQLGAGEHTLLAQSWWLGEEAPYAQTSVRPGFLLAAEGRWQEALSTGIAPWEATLMPGFTFLPPGLAWGAGVNVRIDGATFPWGWEEGVVGDWQAAVPVARGMSAAWKNEIPPYWLLSPATLPPMREVPRTIGKLRFLARRRKPWSTWQIIWRVKPVRGTIGLPAAAA